MKVVVGLIMVIQMLPSIVLAVVGLGLLPQGENFDTNYHTNLAIHKHMFE